MQAPNARLTGWVARWHPYPTGISLGEMLLWISFLGFNIFWVYYWRVTFSYMADKARDLSPSGNEAEITARMFGHMASLLLALVMIPASRTGLLVDIFGVPYDRTLKYHRILGLIAFVMITAHAMTWWGKWQNEGNLVNNCFNYNYLILSPGHVSLMDFSVLIAETGWFIIALSLLSAILFRRQSYALFQYSHKYIGTMLYVTSILHAWSFW